MFFLPNNVKSKVNGQFNNLFQISSVYYYVLYIKTAYDIFVKKYNVDFSNNSF